MDLYIFTLTRLTMSHMGHMDVPHNFNQLFVTQIHLCIYVSRLFIIYIFFKFVIIRIACIEMPSRIFYELKEERKESVRRTTRTLGKSMNGNDSHAVTPSLFSVRFAFSSSRRALSWRRPSFWPAAPAGTPATRPC